MRQRVAGVLFAVIAVAAEVPMTAQDASPALRPESADIRVLMTTGIEQSSTFRDLAGRLNAGDVIVYLRFSRCKGDAPGCLLWASTTPGLRRVLIKIDPIGRSPNELTALLAHELQHALEVADAPEIRDLASFEKAFAGRGWKGTHGFETRQAREVTKRVAGELATAVTRVAPSKRPAPPSGG
jgi:hypothetical protein